jgi:hypothetical protein
MNLQFWHGNIVKIWGRMVKRREFDEPLPQGEGGARKYKAFKPLSFKERGWGEVKFLPIELMLKRRGIWDRYLFRWEDLL